MDPFVFLVLLIIISMILKSQYQSVSVLWVVIGVIVIFSIREFLYNIERLNNRQKYFSLAKKRSALMKKPLLVIGDPYNGVGSRLYGKRYGCGDLCLDLTGCPKCPHGVQGKLEEILPTIGTGQYVVYVSCVLEYVDDIDLCIRELKRISGGDLFVVKVSHHCLWSYFYIGGESRANHRLFTAPPEDTEITYEVNPFRKFQV